MLDSLGVEVFTVETLVGTEIFKSDIMHEPVVFKKIDTDVILSPSEALTNSLNFFGRVDMEYIIRTSQHSREEVISNLKGEIFYNPLSSDWEAKGTFIVGECHRKAERHPCKTGCLSALR